MKAGGLRSQGLIEPGPVGNQQRPHLAEPFIVVGQYGKQTDVFMTVLQNPAFLLQNPVVFRQRRLIIWPQGAQNRIPQSSSGGGAAFENHQILRAEQHRGKHAGYVRGAFLFGPVAPKLPGSSRKQQPTDILLSSLGGNLAGNLSKLPVKADHFPVFLGTEALTAA